MMDERVNERSRPVSRRRMDNQAGLLVERDQEFVLKDNIEWNGFARWFLRHRREWLGLNFQRIPSPQAITRRRLRRSGLQVDEALLQE